MREAAIAYVPGAHGICVELPGQKFPAVHGKQMAAPPCEKVEGSHGVHAVGDALPATGDALPARHGTHVAADDWFVAADHVPAGQGSGAPEAGGQKKPGGQAFAAAFVEPAPHHAPAAHNPLQAGDSRPSASPNVEAGQGTGAPEEAAQKEPRGHLTGAPAFRSQKKPAGHGVAVIDPAGQYVVALQTAPTSTPGPQTVPARHGRGADEFAGHRTPPWPMSGDPGSWREGHASGAHDASGQ